MNSWKSRSFEAWRPGKLSFLIRLLLGSGLALAACGAALLYAILRGEIADQHAKLTEHLREEMLFALPAMSGPAVVGEYSVIEQMVKARARQPVVIVRSDWEPITDGVSGPGDIAVITEP